MPKWYDPEADEKRTRAALSDWVAKRVIVNQSNRQLLNGKFSVYNSTVWTDDSSTVKAYDSKVEAYNSSTVEACDSSRVKAYDSSVIRDYAKRGVRSCSPCAVVIRYEGDRAITTTGGQTKGASVAAIAIDPWICGADNG